VGQSVQEEVAGAEVGCGGTDAVARDEFEGGPCGGPGPTVDVEPHAQQRAQRSPCEVNLDPACAGVAIVLDRPAQQALANAKFAVLLCALPVLKGSHACLERDVDDPPE
jgi:hypothetical protein